MAPRKAPNGSMLPSGKWILRVSLVLWLLIYVFPAMSH